MRKGIAYVVDDDESVRASLTDLLSSVGHRVLTFQSASRYMESARTDTPSALILDVHLPDMSGLELQQRLAPEIHPPIIFISGVGDIPSSVGAMKRGAIDFLPKPFQEQALLDSMEAALKLHEDRLKRYAELRSLKLRHESLTPREREVLPLIVRGLLNKQAAAQLGISEITIQIHRRHIMRKMAVKTFAELVRVSMNLGIASSEPDMDMPRSMAAQWVSSETDCP